MRLPHVTDILKEAGIVDAIWYTAGGASRGSMVHLACQLLDEGDLDLDTLDPRIEGYVRAYAAFRQETGLVGATWIECPMQDPQGLYCGTADRILTARPRKVIDLKTGGYAAWVALQLAAYTNMLPDPYSYDRVAVYLSVDGRYSIRDFPKAEYAADLSVFLSALNLVNWKRRISNGKRS
jgi:hypothetical protein